VSPAAVKLAAAKRQPVAAARRSGPVGRMQAALAIAVDPDQDWKAF